MMKSSALCRVAAACLVAGIGSGTAYAQSQTTPAPLPGNSSPSGNASASGNASSAAEANGGSPNLVSPAGVNGTAAGVVQKPSQPSAIRSATVGGGARQISPGMDVQSRAGQRLGTVADVVKTDSGGPAYIVIADQSGSDTAVPYSVARHMIQGKRIVVEDQQLHGAPKVSGSQLRNPANTTWKSLADDYWSKQPIDQG
jgi:hypothetical protein